MSEPGLYRNGTTGQLRSYAVGRETVSEIQGIEPLAVGTVVDLFTTAIEAINFGTSVAADKNITIGPVGNRIVIDNTTGLEKITHDGNVNITGTETVTGAASFLGNVTLGDAAGDVLAVNATSTFNADVALADATTLTLGTSAPVTVDTTWARISANITFDGVGAHAITQVGQDLTLSTTGAADLLLAGGDHVLLTTGTSVGDAFVVNTNALYVDGPTGNVIVGGALGLPSGNAAALTVNQSVADDPVITLKAGAVSETSILSGSTAPTTGIAAPRGSIYLLNTGVLYVKVNTLDTQWSPVGTVGGNTLQTAYDQVGGDTIDMSVSKDLTFRTDETGGTESDFLVETSSNDAYLLADASALNIDIGSSNVAVRILNDVEMVGTTPTINTTVLDLTLTTTTSGNVIINPADQVGIGTASPSANTTATVSAAADRVLALENVADSAVVELLTGTNPSGITGPTGSLYLEYDNTTGLNAKLWLNQSNGGTGTVWTELSSDASVDQQDAYDNGPGVTMTATLGNMVLTLDETGAFADFIVTGASGNHLHADADANEVYVGSSGIAASLFSPIVAIGTNDAGVNYMMNVVAPTSSITVNANTTTYATNTAAKTLTGQGTNTLTITGTTGGLELNTTTAALNIRTTTGALTIKSTSNGSVFFLSDVAGSGRTALDSGSGGLSLDASNGGSISLGVDALGPAIQITGAGAIDGDASAVDQPITWKAGSDLTLWGGHNAGGAVYIDAAFNAGAGDDGKVLITADKASKFEVASDSLTLSTTTSGDVIVSAAGDTDITGAGNITITTDTAGDNETMMLLTGSDDPTSLAKGATRGSLYLRDDAAEGTLFIKQDEGTTTDWSQVATLVSPISSIIKLDAGGIFVAGDAIYLDSSGDAVATDADVPASSVAIGFALDPAPIGTETDLRIQLTGEVLVSSTLTTLGVYVFLSATTGAVTQTAPVAVGDTVLKMGVVTATGAGTSKVIIQIGESSLN